MSCRERGLSIDGPMEWGYNTLMTILAPQSLRTTVRTGQAFLGLDIGTRTIGLAVSDISHMIASPCETIRRSKLARDSARLTEIVRANAVGGLVVGLPVSMDGTEGPRCQAVRDMTADMIRKVGLPATFWDERLSTAAVERVLIGEADIGRKRRADVIDKMAAAWILQGFLDGR